jgi:hypothetical protein
LDVLNTRFRAVCERKGRHATELAEKKRELAEVEAKIRLGEEQQKGQKKGLLE